MQNATQRKYDHAQRVRRRARTITEQIRARLFECGLKICSNCKVEKSVKDFHTSSNRHDGLQTYCKPCQRKKGLKSDSPERCRLRRYGITSEEFNAMLDAQNGACAICKETTRKLCVDHDHETGVFRAILCLQCNTAIGNLNDSAQRARAAAEYLAKHGKL